MDKKELRRQIRELKRAMTSEQIDAASARLGELNGFVEEMLSGQKTIRAYGREAEVTKRFDEKNHAAVDAYTKAEANGTLTGPSVNFINNLSLALVCVFSSVLLILYSHQNMAYKQNP